MDNPFNLHDHVALVTGAGRGIGRAIATTLARAGARVAVADLEEGLAAGVAEEIRSEDGRSVAIGVDVRQPDSVERMADRAVAELGRIDILVNCAGIVANTPAEDVAPQEWLDILDVNLNGAFWCCQAVGKRMIGQSSGVIVNIASMSGIAVNKPQPQAAYNVSKAGVIMLTKSLAAEWARHGIRVNAVSPGYVATDLTKRGMSNPEWARTWLEATPAGRLGEPIEVAHAVLYLASSVAGFVTGSNLVIDGGYTVW